MISSKPRLYSKEYKFADFGEVKPLQQFIITGKGSRCTSNSIRYYWRLVKGMAPGIVKIENDGESIFLRAPPVECDVQFELKVKDLETEETDAKTIEIKVRSLFL